MLRDPPPQIFKLWKTLSSFSSLKQPVDNQFFTCYPSGKSKHAIASINSENCDSKGKQSNKLKKRKAVRFNVQYCQWCVNVDQKSLKAYRRLAGFVSLTKTKTTSTDGFWLSVDRFVKIYVDLLWRLLRTVISRTFPSV